jgi:hypothetical protein
VDDERWLSCVLRAVGVRGDGEAQTWKGLMEDEVVPPGMTSCGTDGLTEEGTARESLGRAAERTACMVLGVWVEEEGGSVWCSGVEKQSGARRNLLYLVDEKRGATVVDRSGGRRPRGWMTIVGEDGTWRARGAKTDDIVLTGGTAVPIIVVWGNAGAEGRKERHWRCKGGKRTDLRSRTVGMDWKNGARW